MSEYEKQREQQASLIKEGNYVPEHRMTPQEELYAKLFSDEIKLVASMDDLTLRQHREDLSKIAFEARARLTAVGQEVQERVAKKNKSKIFSVALEPDALTKDAINSVKLRERRMSKIEKQIENLIALGMTRAQAEAMFNPSVANQVKTQVHKNEVEAIKNGEIKVEAEQEKPIQVIPKPVNNPFAKKKEATNEQESN